MILLMCDVLCDMLLLVCDTLFRVIFILGSYDSLLRELLVDAAAAGNLQLCLAACRQSMPHVG